MALYDATVPADSESVKLGAQRIRQLTANLNSTLALLFNDDGTLKTTTAWLSPVLTADANGRAQMANSYVTLAKIMSGIFTADTPGRAPFAPGFVTNLLLAAGVLSADTTGQALMADNYFDDTMRSKFVAGFVTQSMLDSGVQKSKAAIAFLTALTSGLVPSSVGVVAGASPTIATTAAHGIGPVAPSTIQPVMFTNASGDGGTIGGITGGTAYFFVPTSTTAGNLYATRALAVAGGAGLNAGTLPSGVTMCWMPVPVAAFNADVTPIVTNSSLTAYGFRVTFGTAFGSPDAYVPVLGQNRSDSAASITGEGTDGSHNVVLHNQLAGSIDMIGHPWFTGLFSSTYIGRLSLAVF